MLRLAFVLPVFAALMPALSHPAAASTELTAGARSRIDAALDQAITEQRLVGAVVLISHDGKLVYERAVGLADREAKRPSRSTRYSGSHRYPSRSYPRPRSR